MFRSVFTLCSFFTAFSTSISAQTPEDAAKFFQGKVLPLLVSNCLECHGTTQKGGLDLRSGEGAFRGGEDGVVLVPGQPEESLLYLHVLNGKMPPKKPLGSEAIGVLRQWIADGAYYPGAPIDPFSVTTERRAGYDWWSFQPLEAIVPPDVEKLDFSFVPSSTLAKTFAEAWAKHPIDRFIFVELIQKGILPSLPATPDALIRRATYDLIGLPPTPEEIEAFKDACKTETGSHNSIGESAYAGLLDRLLASPHYGEHWGRHWLDVVRFGESTGFEVNQIINNMWPYRDYIIKSFNDDKPYNRLIKEHIAGDSLDPGNPEVEIGMCFLVAGPHDIVGNQDPVQAAQIRADGIDEMIRTSAETFLGLTVGCARCHDHKFDPISQRDYYSMYATFAGVFADDREVATLKQRHDRGKALKPLQEKRNAITKDISDIEQAVMKRALAKQAEYEAQWTREKVKRQGTEETFAPVEAKYLRLLAEGVDTNLDARSGFKIDEFEVWSDACGLGVPPMGAGDHGRDAHATAACNIAAARNGAKAEGTNSVPGDFGAAYQPLLTIDEQFGQSWIAGGSELKITFAQPTKINRVFFSSDRPGALGDNPEARFVSEYTIEISLNGIDWTRVADSHNRQPISEVHRNKRMREAEITEEEAQRLAELNAKLAELDKGIAAVPALPVMRVGKLSDIKEAVHVFLGGDPQRLGEGIAPASLASIKEVPENFTLDNASPEKNRRETFAKWLASAQNPLTARVMVNRLWHYHFGRGIVATPSDFGFMGVAPTHPELLDWLAKEFVAPTNSVDAWRFKRMHKLIMTSQAYQQAGVYRESAAQADGDALYLWRFPPRRLSAEEIRDSMLAVSGMLDTRMGGPGYRLYSYLQDNVATYVPLEKHGDETYRRAVYHQNARAAQLDLLSDYDAPDCALSMPRRASTTTPIQALSMMNHSFTLDMAEKLAERIERETGNMDIARLVQRSYQLLFGRDAKQEEIEAAQDLIGKYGLRAFCRAIFNANEFVYVE